MNTKCLVVGYGSIGARHASILSELGCDVSCVSKRKDVPFTTYDSIEKAVGEFAPELVIISNPTSEHFGACKELEKIKYDGALLIEKPIFDRLPSEKIAFPNETFIAYNLRFNPIVQRLESMIHGREIFSAQLSVGQYLPTWRQGRDYRKCYSASVKDGGGVLRDLSHELDLSLWLFGGWKKFAALCGRFGNLEIETEDTAEIIARTERCPSLSVHLDYHSLFPIRRITVQADGLSYEADLIKSTIRTHEGEEFFEVGRDTTYIAQLKAILSKDYSSLCRVKDGLEVVRIIERIGAERLI